MGNYAEYNLQVQYMEGEKQYWALTKTIKDFN